VFSLDPSGKRANKFRKRIDVRMVRYKLSVERAWGIGYIFIASLFFGLGAVLAKLVAEEIDPVVIAFLDLAIGGLLLVGYLLFTRTSLIRVAFTVAKTPNYPNITHYRAGTFSVEL
jgi:EamA-like transporter family